LNTELPATDLAAHDDALEEVQEIAPRRRRRIPASLVFGGAAVGLCVLVAAIGPYFAPYDPVNGNMLASLAPPSSAHLLGTDLYGRDVLTRIIYGARLAIGLSVAVVVASCIIGSLYGLMAGYFRGPAETTLMRIVDIFISFPSIVLVVAVLAVLGPGLVTLVVAIAAVDWTTYARLMHSQVLSIREREYIEACRALGMSPARTTLKHILPNALSAALVYASLDVTQVILAISALSFLGIGVQPPQADWGSMINDGRSLIYLSWWISTFPGIAVILTGLAFSLLGDGLADALEIRL
jgi:peptide/nickel transport system permease protein